MNWLKKLFGFKQQSPKEAKKETKKSSISSGVNIGKNLVYGGFDIQPYSDNDIYNPLSPTSPFFYGQNHEESVPAPNQEQHHTHRHDSETIDNSHWHHHHHTGDSHLHDYPSSPSDTASYDSGCTDNNSSGSDY